MGCRDDAGMAFDFKLTKLVANPLLPVFHYVHGRTQAQPQGKRSATSFPYGTHVVLLSIQRQPGVGGQGKDPALVRSFVYAYSSSPAEILPFARLIELNGMKASDEITEEQSRQVGFSFTPTSLPG